MNGRMRMPGARWFDARVDGRSNDRSDDGLRNGSSGIGVRNDDRRVGAAWPTPARPTWWWLLAAFLAFAVIVTGAFVWQRATRMTAQRIYGELVALDPSVTADQLKDRGYVYGGEAVEGWAGVDDDAYPWYLYGESGGNERIDKFIADVKAGRESVLKLYVRGVGPYRTLQDGSADDGAAGGGTTADGASVSGTPGVSVRVLWYDPDADATWAEKPSGAEPAIIHHDGKGQIREWWWRDGEVVTSDKRFSRGIGRDDSLGATYVLRHQPQVPQNAKASDGTTAKSKTKPDTTVIVRRDEVLYSYGAPR
ncbi:hypothetical protein JS528_07550 [Bifidobacterium sp. MA2]|uniref:Uncharacterized protein n=1 Tax=Bifidobacterium santillanense TaxID=2809028 RepID=A0ABS5UQN8_9BIFI|nr:hypothetical protein [Bifidobacterium santillanense]MBT1173207.1 hypothetical protein [Bifidobacterium santillanense]